MKDEGEDIRTQWRVRFKIPRVDPRNLEATDADVLEDMLTLHYHDRAEWAARDPKGAEADRLANDPEAAEADREELTTYNETLEAVIAKAAVLNAITKRAKAVSLRLPGDPDRKRPVRP